MNASSTLTQTSSPVIGIVMGSNSDWPTMQAAAKVLKDFGVPFEARVVSAHRRIRRQRKPALE